MQPPMLIRRCGNYVYSKCEWFLFCNTKCRHHDAIREMFIEKKS